MRPETRLPTPTLPAAVLAAVLLAAPAAAALPGPPTDPGASTPSPSAPAATAGGEEDRRSVSGDAAGPDDSPPPPAASRRLEIHRRNDLEPPDRASMEEWHRRYVRLAAPVKKALGEVLAARRGHLPHRALPHCRRLLRELQRFRRQAREERLLPLADAAADLHLKRLYLRLEDAGRACTEERWGATEEHLRQAGLAFRQAELVLARWGLEP